jgi:MATE family multidrug resistance protein
MQNSLTRHPEGSIRELWTISLPLMISALASLFMIFTDRIFLSHYSIGALNASVNAGTLAWALMSGIGMITAMSEVFVAQYNGAGLHKRLGIPVWQMLWFALFSILFFLPIAIWGSAAIFSSDRYADLEIPYFRWLMIFGPSYAILTSFSGFFIGRGKTKILIWLAIVANLINIGLDWTLIFGIPGLIPEMGIEGAAIATCCGYLFESVALCYLFLKKENRVSFGTDQWRLNWTEMKKCCKVGIPQGVFCAVEMLGWSVFYWMMTDLGEKHITISSICQSFTILLFFFCDGLSRGAAAVAGNLIGSRKFHLVKKVLRSGFCLLVLFSLCTALILLVDPVDTVRFLFIQSPDYAILESLKMCMIFAFAYIFFDGLRWFFSGLLVAAGDTRFLLIAGSCSVWLFLLAPTYLIVVRGNLDIEYAWGLTVLYAILFFAIYWLRFKQGAWQKINLLTGLTEQTYTEPSTLQKNAHSAQIEIEDAP